jgi:hypothetical protein
LVIFIFCLVLAITPNTDPGPTRALSFDQVRFGGQADDKFLYNGTWKTTPVYKSITTSTTTTTATSTTTTERYSEWKIQIVWKKFVLVNSAGR